MTRDQMWVGFLATGLLLVSLAMLIVREPTAQARAADSQLQAAVSEGTDVYLDYCAACHGAAGEGLGPYPSLSVAATMDADALYKTIERGRYDTQMAPYGLDEGGVLSAAQIDSLVALIQYGNWDAVYMLAGERGVLPPEPAVVEVSAETVAEVAALPAGDQLSAGLLLYAENCAACHGANLEGSTLAPALNTDELRALEGFDLARVINQGVPGTLMAGWDAALSDDAVNALVALVLRWPEVQSAGVAIPVVATAPIDMSPEAIAEGARLFDILCASCHGQDGYGTRMAPALNNDLFLTNTADAAIRQIIGMGVSDTVMPAWDGRLSEAQINAIVAFLRSQAPDAPIITDER